MRKVDSEYRLENLKEWEIKSLSEKNELEKPTLKFIFQSLFFIIVLALIVPYFPVIKPGRTFNPPQSINEYFKDVSFTVLVIFSILFFSIIFSFLRNKIDEKGKMKKVGNFEIKRKINFGNYTFIQLNSLKFLILKSEYNGLKTAKVGQIIKVKKTVTNKIISLYIRDKLKFETE